MRPEIIHRELQYSLHLLQLKRASTEFGSRQWRLVAVTKQMPVIRAARRCGAQQIFGQDYSCPGARTEATMTAFTDAVEAIAGSNHPRIRSRSPEIFAEIFKYR